jgi:capsular polysaccharide biosynthesis protein
MEFTDIISAIRRRWRIAVALVLLTGAAVAVFLVTREEVHPDPRYEGQVLVLVPVRDERGNAPENVPSQLLYGQAALALSQQVREDALRAANVPASEAQNVGFAFEVNEGGDLYTLSVTADDELTARVTADAFGGAYLDARRDSVSQGSEEGREQARTGVGILTERLEEVDSELRAIDPALHAQVSATPASTDEEGEPTRAATIGDVPIDTALLVYERDQLLATLEGARREYATRAVNTLVPSNYAEIVERPAVLNTTPGLPSPITQVAVIVGVGLLLALALPVLVDRMDHSIRDAKTASAALAAPVLTSIPAANGAKLEALVTPGSARDGAFRALAAASVATDRLPRAIVVTSPTESVQDTVAANFAAALAGLGVRVALVGTSPRQAWFADTASAEPNGESTTFPELLELAYTGRMNGEVPQHLLPTQFENMYVLPPGSAEIDVSLDGLPPLLDALSSASFDCTVIAAAGLLDEPNTTIYAWATRSVLWVLEKGEITVEQAREGADRLARAGVTPFGVALVDTEA